MKVENVICAIGTTVITVMERGKHVGILLALSSSDDEDDESSDEDISNVITSVLLISYVQPYMSYGEGRGVLSISCRAPNKNNPRLL